LSYVEHIRLLSCEFEIRTNSQELIDRLSYITQRAEQDVSVAHRCAVTITWTGDEFSISGDGMEDDFEFSVTSALETLYERLHGRAIAALPDHIRINAAIRKRAALWRSIRWSSESHGGSRPLQSRRCCTSSPITAPEPRCGAAAR